MSKIEADLEAAENGLLQAVQLSLSHRGDLRDAGLWTEEMQRDREKRSSDVREAFAALGRLKEALTR